jgi:uncharacterized hydrophobic protein (TIGR00271 family)
MEKEDNTDIKTGDTAGFRDYLSQALKYVKSLINLSEDMADPMQTIRNIEKSVVFRGTNVWILMFSILIASLGLNINSNPVIIGAMLVSPLLGPILGVGTGIGINSLSLIKKSLRNFLVMVIISILTSTFYFILTPLSDAQSELLARTNPTIFDVGIAFFGGLAGIIASTRAEKSTVIPGVAIATALMPPLCTAGYGIATLQFNFFIGAIYLFFINSVFICLATIIIIRYLKFPTRIFVDKARERKVRSYIGLVVVLTLLPSIYIAYEVVQKSVFLRNANTFLNQYLEFPNTKIINSSFEYQPRDTSLIDITLLGEPLDDTVIDYIKSKMKTSGLSKAKLTIHQGMGIGYEKGLLENLNKSLKSDILEQVFYKRESEIDSLKAQINLLETQFGPYTELNSEAGDISREISVQYPGVSSFALTNSIRNNITSTARDTTTIALVQIDRAKFRNKNQFEAWMKVRIKNPEIEFIYY